MPVKMKIKKNDQVIVISHNGDERQLDDHVHVNLVASVREVRAGVYLVQSWNKILAILR